MIKKKRVMLFLKVVFMSGVLKIQYLHINIQYNLGWNKQLEIIL